MSEEQSPRTQKEVEADIALKEADLVLRQLEAEEKRATIRVELAKAEREEVSARSYALDLEKKEETRILEKANDHYHRTYHFTGVVNLKSVEDCMDRTTLWDRTDAECDIEIVFNSPGGDVVSGMALFDHIEELSRRHKVTCTAQGMAASMAGILLQSGGIRRMTPGAWVLIHQISGGVMGSFGDMEDRIEWIRRVQDRVLDIFADRARKSGAPKPLTKATFKKNWERKDWWLSADDCLKAGIIDEIA